MLSKRPRPVIGKISELLISGHRSSELATSPRSPLDFLKIQSPRTPKTYAAGGVGLAIVAALEKSSEPKYSICTQTLCRSNPVQDEESFEDYTVVTCRGSDRSFTKVYYGGVLETTTINKKSGESEEKDLYPRSSFLSSCDLCRKSLHGQDIYMYRGEKAFCSNECRASQMLMDERKEKCRSEASRSGDVSSSAYTRGQIFSASIAAV